MKKRATKNVAKKQVTKRPPGRPSLWSEALGEAIAKRLSKGEPMASICRDEGMPHVSTVHDWMAAHEGFSRSIARAREDGFDHLAAECLDIADHTHLDTLVGDGERDDRPNTEWITRSRLRIETRLKLLAKWDPKRYGDRIDVEHGGEVEVVVRIGGSKE